jgi:hypothetical protein
MWIKKAVTHESSDEEIFAAIREAGEYRHYWRQNDWPKPEENCQYAWVKPGDIGHSTSQDQRLYKRLKKMTGDGKLEMMYASSFASSYIKKRRGYSQGGAIQGWKQGGNWPRFRVIEK